MTKVRWMAVFGWILWLAAGLTPATATAAMPVIFGPDAQACQNGNGTPAFLVRVYGFKRPTGVVRVQIYGDQPEDFLAPGKYLKRIDLPVAEGKEMHVCVALPQAGDYVVAVRHDMNGDGKSGWNDGGGFSRNPNISLFHLRPNYKDVVLSARSGVQPVDVVLNYRSGLSIRPIKDADK